MSDDDKSNVIPISREAARSRRKREVRARTVSVKRMTKRELELGRLLNPEVDVQRPETRADCQARDRSKPCPFVACKFNLYLDVSKKTGAIKLNFPDLEVWEMDAKKCCVLDITENGGQTLEEVGAIMNLTRERVRQIEVKGLTTMQKAVRREHLDLALEEPRRSVPAPLQSGEFTCEEEIEDVAHGAVALPREAV